MTDNPPDRPDYSDIQRSFTIHGKVKPKQRARVTKRGNTYTPKETTIAEAYVRERYFATYAGCEPFSGPLSVELCFYRQPPISWSKWKQASALDGTLYDVSGGDVDNKAKTVLDALNGVAFRDDRQITQLTISKGFSASDYATVLIRQFKQDEAPKSNKNRANQVNVKGGQLTYREKMLRKHYGDRIPGMKSSGGVYGKE